MSRLAVIAVFGMMLGVLSNRSEAAPSGLADGTAT